MAASGENPNKAVMDFLHQYSAPESQYDYAVMLRGKWGAGKTYLIRKFIKEREDKGLKKNLYVSLYGITSSKSMKRSFASCIRFWHQRE
jgi:hypothetical protein